MLALANFTGARVSAEIKNQPTDPDFNVPPDFADRVLNAIKQSGFPPSRLIIQSFWFPNLDRAHVLMPDVETSNLALGAGSPAYVDGRHDDWISAQWPAAASTISDAHARGLRVVPYTIDARDDIAAAVKAGVDELITNDPLLARRTEGELETKAPPIPPPPSPSGPAAPPGRAAASARSRLPAHTGTACASSRCSSSRSFATSDLCGLPAKIECMIREYVVSRWRGRRPNVVAFNEDVGLMTLATGSRGARGARIDRGPGGPPAAPGAGFPCAAVSTLLAEQRVYARARRLPGALPATGLVSGVFVAATDTFARGGCRSSRDMAHRYDVYMLGLQRSGALPRVRDPAEIDTFRDPDPPRPTASSWRPAPRSTTRPSSGARDTCAGRGRGPCATWSPRTGRCR